MKIWEKFVANVKLRRWCVLLVLIAILYLMRSMISMLLLTFIFALLVTKLVNFIRKYVKIPSPLLVVLIYIIFIGGIITAVAVYSPVIYDQAVTASKHVIAFYDDPNNMEGANQFQDWISSFIHRSNFLTEVKGGLDFLFQYVSSIGQMGVTFLLSLILSFFFTLEEKSMAEFSKRFLTSEFDWFFQDVYYFAKTFTKTFGVVLEAQFLIAIFNTIFTTIIMAFLGMPQLFILGIVVFFLSLVPVAGVIISLIPLSIVGYSVGGIKYIIYLVIMVAVVHLLEAYILNPKLMSSRTELPIFYTFCALMIGEEIFGGWGLIVSVPILTFFLEIIGVKGENKKSLKMKRIMK
ncbi:AI-2E family transporter [Apilactobacillus micheneri]|uniref:AI-2E family transporter n=1 Tax=Apilactobacillus micheneri TaxID=1899430 RepID=UPI000D02F8D5|nr:AI-2E family transporter [Apilactobacillus micheneri]TPR37609.1 AI-2E family transporter [Apilactobacillus micheneri]TPR37996.1 AI-2E family transporter [Apilactobacillus micheneri]